MKRALRILLAAETGAILGGLVWTAGETVLDRKIGVSATELLCFLAVLMPVTLVVSLSVFASVMLFFPKSVLSVRDLMEATARWSVLERIRFSTWSIASVVLTLMLVLILGQTAAEFMRGQEPAVAGGNMGLSSVLFAWCFVLVPLSAFPSIRRWFLSSDARTKWGIRVPQMLVLAMCLAFVLVTTGMLLGNASGEGHTPLALLGLLRRPELNLRPMFLLCVMGAASFVWLQRWAEWKSHLAIVLLAFGIVAGSATRESSFFASAEQRSALAKAGLGVLRRATDRDHDGFSPYFGGGDCDDHNPTRSPKAADVPGNSIDEDCSGMDAPIEAAVTDLQDAQPTEVSSRFSGYNLLLITVDTLRTDLGFNGYAKPVSPNLDALAKDAVVFERMYAMASYTGKSLPPFLIGKYPSETHRNGAHFNTYYAANIFLAERLKKAGYSTAAVGSHVYFSGWSGIGQGFDEIDLSARAVKGGDSDTAITGEAVTAAGLKYLRAFEAGPSFLWVHYFDPHAQYIPHPGAPDFGEGARALYDGEVWFTDQQIGKLLSAIPENVRAKTIVCMTSDHGEAFGEHRMRLHGFELWEPLVKVPFVVAIPGQKAARVGERRSHIDFVPTMLDLLGVDAPTAELSGRSFASDVLGTVPVKESDGGIAASDRDIWIDMPAGPNNSLRKALIYGPGAGIKVIHFGGQRYSLFNLSNDPEEKNDLIGVDPQLTREALTRFERAKARRKEIDVPPE